MMISPQSGVKLSYLRLVEQSTAGQTVQAEYCGRWREAQQGNYILIMKQFDSWDGGNQSLCELSRLGARTFSSIFE